MEPFRRCPAVVGRNRRDRPRPARAEPFEEADGILGVRLRLGAVGHVVVSLSASRPEIGRASCRERVCQYVLISVVAVSLKKKPTLIYTTSLVSTSTYTFTSF